MRELAQRTHDVRATHRDEHRDAGYAPRACVLEPRKERVGRERAEGRGEAERGDVFLAVRAGERGREEGRREREGRRGCPTRHPNMNPISARGRGSVVPRNAYGRVLVEVDDRENGRPTLVHDGRWREMEAR